MWIKKWLPFKCKWNLQACWKCAARDPRSFMSLTKSVLFSLEAYLLSLFNFILYWSIVDWQCCVHFKCTAKWLLYIHTYPFFFNSFPFRLLHNIEQRALCYTVGPCWVSLLNIVVCTCQSQTSNLSLPHPITINLLFVWMSLFCKLVHLYHFS